MGHPLHALSVFEMDDSNTPIYEEVLAAQETPSSTAHQQMPLSDKCSRKSPPSVPFRPPPSAKDTLPLAVQERTKVHSVSSVDEEEQDSNIIKDEDQLIIWWRKFQNESWENISNEHAMKEEKQFTVKAERVLNAVQLYNLLLNTHGETMKNQITELNDIADNLDKVSKGTKIAGITGGATGAVGGVAAVAGVVLAPLTFGASLALTALGVGVAAAGGVTGASAAIANKVSRTIDRKKIELILQDFQAHMDDIEACLRFIVMGIEHLRKHNLSTLQGVNTTTLRVAKVADVTNFVSISAMKAGSKLSGSLQGFALGMDMYLTKKKDGRKQVKKELKSEFARKLRQLAQQLYEGLKELFKVKENLVENDIIFNKAK
ncbi:hypothetical protein UPYG_G00061710 [Umbra pygmaea]|uniref:Uncharacterized protein n=1 Tax=Umbra pygmaea TaxID=75934 RepID=A0ABD0X9I0_UMBPY